MASESSSTTAEQESTSQHSNPEMIITKGKTFLAVQNYYNAVGLLADGCRLLTDKYGETADELAEPYLFYGRALLGLAREEQELAVLGTGVPGTQEDEEDVANEESTSASATEEKVEEKSGSKDEIEKNIENEEDKEIKETEIKSNGEASTSTSSQQNGKVYENGCDEAATAEEEGDEEGEEEEEGVPEGDGEDVENEDDDGSSNLQIAWEVLELSKMIFQKRNDSAEKTQFLSEAHRLLGEVALESGNHTGAVGDLSTCLELMQDLEKVPSRQLAEVHYQLGLAYSLGSEYTKSIEHYEQALKYLDERVTYLKSIKEPQQDADLKHDPEEEIKEIQELIPDIQEKIDDVKDMKQQACKVLLESIKEHIGEGSCSNGAGPSGASTSAAGSSTSHSSSTVGAKPVSDINHLIRKKRKNEDGEPEGSPCKKSNDALPGKSV